ncbi:CDP-alcohol phosphatidyltransferase family protein [Sedimentitalea todarodis]|uniref:CDP-alcohol phosphatidyltransferase family protein n=1 Tax=Sedimentitalea todarodis TaxID=1631240 RepID=A0ABU3VDW5_9RHOB|nr:CDP-alcohol phosphatidyltransferase family protein [Sedimentitalea todarodis]MDU9004370.1 CDP-alcohol phosphatidyltransferase family protein [Sedimentitalea todarodis]
MTTRAASVFMHPGIAFAALSLVLLPTIWVVADRAYGGAILPVAMFLMIAATAGVGLMRRYTHPTLGACNIITLLRAAIVCILAGAIIAPPTTELAHWSICATALLALSLDGLDGWLARRSDLTSNFGAQFDMETDALLGGVLAMIAWHSSAANVLLLLGFMRYLFVVATWIWPWMSAPLPESMRRKTICVIQIAALIVLVVPNLPQALSVLVAYGATAVLAWSFAVDIVLLWRRRA